jgi:tRNA(Ile)-lysidine synthase
MSMQKRFLEQLESLGCRGKRILVAVSGGLDSVVLLDLLIKSRYTIAVAHANFQLRGVESDGDETFVKQLALSSKIPVYVQSFDTNNYAIEKGVSIQMAARDLRYAWFFDVLDREKFDLVATAHHLNDNLETSLINFVRGTGLQGFLGI